MAESQQLPSNLVAQEFGEVNVRPVGAELEVTFTVAMEPQGAGAEGWQTGVALDASASMQKAFGRQLVGTVPPAVLAEYREKGWAVDRAEDGNRATKLTTPGREDAVRRGFVKPSENVVEPRAREFVSYLAGNLDADGGTTVVYWACGDGRGVEAVGDFTAEQCKGLELRGPVRARFGTATHLLPAVEYFTARFAAAARGMYLFVTDGRLSDLDAVKRFTVHLAREIAAGRRNPVKCVLIGVGDEVDERQMEELDDLDTGTDVDVWDHKIAAEMRGLLDIFAEVVDENQIVAPRAALLDPSGTVVKQFLDGMPARVTFRLPAAAAWFELEIEDQRVRQPLR
ncbi:vWA domain-containing protein [Gemmata sp.]|uniref:vWA domain-containing protein n=1 Tax=Gemmata sp. TaxID=1914242 RepID=UPI003F6F8887